jgi:hypothetical protein
MARKSSMLWIGIVVGIVLLGIVLLVPGSAIGGCPGSQIYCPGVGCVSGQDKCFPGARGGPSAVFSKEGFVNKQCPDKTRSDGPCLMEF